ncbi:hypothetical protein [Altererythrobacter sp. GH1-8]
MSNFKQQSLAAASAIFISIVSLQAIVTVPPAQAQSTATQQVELA